MIARALCVVLGILLATEQSDARCFLIFCSPTYHHRHHRHAHHRRVHKILIVKKTIVIQKNVIVKEVKKPLLF
jgi:hypothetical protein